ncbi:hypothetical protein DXT66_26060 [Nocardia farcinica]|nr:hypothetical protein DXT66_26060 [Nocardia farcinica]
MDAQQALADAYTTLADAQATYAEASQAVTDAMNESSSAADEYEKALGKLSPAARAFVEQMLALRGPYGELRQFVQEKLFDQLGTSISSLATNYLPTLREGLGGIANAINQGVRKAIADLDTDANRLTLANIFDNVEASVTPFLNGLSNVLQAFLALSEVGSEFMPGAAKGFEDVTKKFKDWANSDEGKSKFRNFLQESIKTFKDLWNIGKQVFALIQNIFRGADETGESWLTSIAETLKRWNESLSTEEGQKKLRDFFDNVRTTVGAITTMISAAAGLIDKLSASPLGDVMSVFDEDKSAGEKAKSVGGGLLRGAIGYSPIGLVWNATGASDKVKEAWSGFTSDFDKGAGTVMGRLYEMGTGFADWATNGEDSITTRIGGAFSGFTSNLPGVSTKLGEFRDDASDKFNTFKNTVTTVFSTLTGPEVLGKFKSELNTLPGFFDGLVLGIARAWSNVSSALQGPINTVIDTLNSFGDIWNRVAKKLGLPEWEPIDHVGVTGQTGTFDKPLVGARAMGGPGGPVHGPGNGKDDRAGLYRLSRGEHVWTADEVRAAGGHEAMYRMRRTVLKGGGTQAKPDGPLPGYRDGGIVQTSDPLDPIQVHLWDLVRNAIPGAILTSAKRFVDVGSGYDLHMQGKAIDLGGPMKEIARWIYNTYPQSAELIHWPLDGWQNLDEGRPFDFGSGTNEQHRDHVHWAANDFLTEMSEDDKRSLFDRVRAGIGGLVSSGRSLMIDNLLAKPLRGLADQVPVFDQLGEFGQMPRAFARKMADAVIGWVTSRLGGESGGGVVDYDPAWGVEHWREMAKEAMRRVGFNADDENQVNAMLAQIKSESGGNPNIAQQIVDVNGTGEAAGVGLLQIIPGTYEAYRDPELPNNRRDPFSNMVAALRYYKARYGMDLTTMWGKGHGYDQGGIFPHGTWGFNASGLPEAVLTNPQWRLFEQFIRQMPGMEQKLQALPQPVPGQMAPLPQPMGGGTSADGTPGTYGVPVNPGVDTLEIVGNKARERYTSALKTGFDGLISSTLDPLGLPDPRSLIPSEVTEYGKTLDAWHQARIASAQASGALAQSGYQAAPAPAATANQVIQSGGSGTELATYDYSTHITIQTRDVDEGYRKAQQMADLRAIQHTGTARG